MIAQSVLYDDTYTHRTSTSPIATRGNDFFYQQLQKISNGRRFKSMLEIGCNDLYLLNRTQGLAEQSVGVDPIWIGRDHDLNATTRVLGRFVEDIKMDEDVIDKPDLVLSAHTFEHIQDIHEQLASLVDIAADGCLFVIEVPGFDSMVKLRRFDQVFHQHIQYTSLSSMRRLVRRLGCHFLGHIYNYSYWGGTFLFWFEKNKIEDGAGLQGFEPQPYKVVKAAFAEFKTILKFSVDKATGFGEQCFGFGAAQMLPILAYHMESDLGFMDAILDDNPERSMCRLPGVSPLIRVPRERELRDAAVMVTALDSSRAILKRLIELEPRRILHPMNSF
ncbi:MAG: methyltransferase domain-containing protein [Candidatus Roizmanbacteria bacterium]|nr:methyltransferase domain-containing protein [Candidatus Roizmanbacteria bacterium]